MSKIESPMDMDRLKRFEAIRAMFTEEELIELQEARAAADELADQCEAADAEEAANMIRGGTFILDCILEPSIYAI